MVGVSPREGFVNSARSLHPELGPPCAGVAVVSGLVDLGQALPSGKRGNKGNSREGRNVPVPAV